MFPQVARASLLDSLNFNLFHVIPMALQGIFKKRPFWVRLFGRLHPDPLGKRFISRMRSKYHTPYIDLLMRGAPDSCSTRGNPTLLEHSPETYADPKSKRAGWPFSAKRFDDLADAAVGRAAVVQRRYSAGASAPLTAFP